MRCHSIKKIQRALSLILITKSSHMNCKHTIARSMLSKGQTCHLMVAVSVWINKAENCSVVVNPWLKSDVQVKTMQEKTKQKLFLMKHIIKLLKKIIWIHFKMFSSFYKKSIPVTGKLKTVITVFLSFFFLFFSRYFDE